MKKALLVLTAAVLLTGSVVVLAGCTCPFTKKEAGACPADCTKPCCAK